ncbi:MAG: hypothetical protein HQ503_17495 [Rhodospirillales bacterium]|nr:hypothetical protein [Rhodospirillales bacterium]
MTVVAIYCADGAASEISAYSDRISSVDDPRLAEIINGLAWKMIPSDREALYPRSRN